MILTRLLRNIFSGRPAGTDSMHPSAPPIADEVAKVLPELTTPAKDQLFNFFMPMFWGTSNAEAVTASAQSIVKYATSGHHFADNFLTWCRNMSMLDDLP